MALDINIYSMIYMYSLGWNVNLLSTLMLTLLSPTCLVSTLVKQRAYLEVSYIPVPPKYTLSDFIYIFPFVTF